MMPTFSIIKKGGGEKPKLVAHTRHEESRGREASSSFVSTSDATHVTHKTNEQTKKKRTKKNGRVSPLRSFSKSVKFLFFLDNNSFGRWMTMTTRERCFEEEEEIKKSLPRRRYKRKQLSKEKEDDDVGEDIL